MNKQQSDNISEELLNKRIFTHRLTSQQPFQSVKELIDSSICIQAQDEALAFYSIHLRTRLDKEEIIKQLHTDVLRTHILRPTWHYVNKDDIRWLLELTGSKIISSLRSFQYKLGITEEVVMQSEEIVKKTLAQQALTKNQLSEILPQTNFEKRGQVVSHILLILEAKGLVCMEAGVGKNKGKYMLLDHFVAPLNSFDRQVAIEEFVFRFLRGHGTASMKDILSWSNITKREALAALEQVADGMIVYDGVQHWYMGRTSENVKPMSALLPTFDELLLTHKELNFPRLNDYRQNITFQNGGGHIILNNVNVGIFKRKHKRKDHIQFEVLVPESFSDLEALHDLLTHYAQFEQAKDYSLELSHLK